MKKNILENLAGLIDAINNQRGGVFHLVIEHQDGCPALWGGDCTCREEPSGKEAVHECAR